MLSLSPERKINILGFRYSTKEIISNIILVITGYITFLGICRVVIFLAELFKISA